MVDKIYYIKGSKENPEGVKQALLEVYPDIKNNLNYNIENFIYYGLNGRIDYADDDSHINLLKAVGIELQPKKQEKFVEKTMYSPMIKVRCNNTYFLSSDVFETKEEALKYHEAIGYREVKVIIKE